jgi:nitrogen fixation protein FixH
MTATASRTGFVLKGWHVLAALVVFFGIDIAVNTYFMVAAYRTFPGETSVTPYEDGLAYNTALQQRRAQAQLGWRLTGGVGAPDRIRVEVFDPSGAPLSGLRVTANLRRPATDAGQHTATLRETGPGVYTAEHERLPGAWDLDVTARNDRGDTARAERRLYQP